MAALLAVGAVFGPIVILGYSFSPFNHPEVVSNGPFGYSGPPLPHFHTLDPSGAWLDYVWAIQTTDALKEGTIPLWDPYQGLGQPSAYSQHLSGALHPLNWLRLIVPNRWWDILALINLALIMYFSSLYFRAIGFNFIIATVAGLSYITCGNFSLWLVCDTILRPVPWIILLLYSIERALPIEAASGRDRWFPLLVIASSYSLATAGNPSPTVFGFFAVSLYCLIRCGIPAKFRRLCISFFAYSALGILLAAPEWLTFMDYAVRMHSEFASYAPPEFTWINMPKVFLPNAFDWGIQWFPSTLSFLAIGGIATLRPRRIPVPILILLGISLVFLWRYFDIYPSAVMKELPLIRRLNFYYAAFIPGFAWCGLAAMGFARMCASPANFFKSAFAAWGLFIACLLVSVVAIEPGTISSFEDVIRRLVYNSHYVSTSRTITAYAWLVLSPAALLSLHLRRIGSLDRYALVASCALLIQMACYFPNGSDGGYEFAAVAGIACYIFAVTLIHLINAIGLPKLKLLPLLTPVLLVFTIYSIRPGQPDRYGLLRRGPVIDELSRRCRFGERCYGLGLNLFGDTTGLFHLSGMNTLQVMIPPQAAEFFHRYLDPAQAPTSVHGLPADAAFRTLLRNRQFWELIGVRYIVASNLPNDHTVYSSPRTDHVPLLLASPISIVIPPSVKAVKSMRIFVSTYGPAMPGTLKLSAYDDTSTAAIAEGSSSRVFLDNTWPVVELDREVANKAKLRLKLSFVPGTANANLWVWHSASTDSFGDLELYTENSFAGLNCIFHDPDTMIGIWEIPSARPRAFFLPRIEWVDNNEIALSKIPELAGSPQTAYIDRKFQDRCKLSSMQSAAGKGKLVKLDVQRNRVIVGYDCDGPGVLVLSDAFWPGWKARVNGSDADVFPVCGLFRGVCIAEAGHAEIEFYYEPLLWKTALAVALAAMLVVIVVVFCSMQLTCSEALRSAKGWIMIGLTSEHGKRELSSRVAAIAESVVVWGVGIYMFIVAYGISASCAPAIPYWEEWDWIPVVTRKVPMSWHFLWAQVNEHRLPLGKLIYCLLGRWFDAETAPHMLFNLGLLGVFAAVFVLLIRRLRGRTSIYDLFFPLLWLHLGHYESILAPATGNLLTTVGILIFFWLVVTIKSAVSLREALALGAAVTILPVIGTAPGWIITPPLVAWMLFAGIILYRKGLRQPAFAFFGACLTATSVVLLYFWGWERPHAMPRSTSLWSTTRGTLEVAGSCFGNNGPREILGFWWASALVVLFFGSTLALLASKWKNREEWLRLTAFGILFACFFGLCLAMGIGRAGLGENAGYAGRYTNYSAPFLALCYIVWEIYGQASWKRLFQFSLCAVMLLVVYGNQTEGRMLMTALENRPREFIKDIERGWGIVELSDKYDGVFFPPAAEAGPVFLEGLKDLRDARMSVFARYSVPYRIENRALPSPLTPQDASKITPPLAYKPQGTMNLNGSVREHVFMLHPAAIEPGTMTFNGLVEVPKIRFSIGMHPQSISDPAGHSDGAEFRVTLQDEGEVDKVLFSKFLNPFSVVADRNWTDGELDLSPYKGKRVTLLVQTFSGPAHDYTYDWALWTFEP